MHIPNHIPLKYKCPYSCYVDILHICLPEGHFTHKTKSPWPLHSKISHWSKRWRSFELIDTRRWRSKGPNNSSRIKKIYVDSYNIWQTINNVSWFVKICVKPNANYGINMSIIWPLIETQGSPQLSHMVMACVWVAP